MTQTDALKLALEALLWANKEINGWRDDAYGYEAEDQPEIMSAVNAIKEALAQPEQEPVAMVESVATVVSESGNQEVTMSWWHEPALPVGTKLYTLPLQRKPLTDEELLVLLSNVDERAARLPKGLRYFARAIEAAHSNWGGGKGRGIKADDNLVAALCLNCHYEIDQGKNLSKLDRQVLWNNAHRATVFLLCKRGLWPSDVPLPSG